MNQIVHFMTEPAIQRKWRSCCAGQSVTGLVHCHFTPEDHHSTGRSTASHNYSAEYRNHLRRAFFKTFLSDGTLGGHQKALTALRYIFCAGPRNVAIPVLLTLRFWCSASQQFRMTQNRADTPAFGYAI